MIRNQLQRALVGAAVVVVLLQGVALVRGAMSNTYTGCLTAKGDVYNVQIGSTPLLPCKDKEQEVSWNETGPQGPAGPAGAPGPTLANFNDLQGTPCSINNPDTPGTPIAGTLQVYIGFPTPLPYADGTVALECKPNVIVTITINVSGPGTVTYNGMGFSYSAGPAGSCTSTCPYKQPLSYGTNINPVPDPGATLLSQTCAPIACPSGFFAATQDFTWDFVFAAQ